MTIPSAAKITLTILKIITFESDKKNADLQR